jgi:hypothetical protein
MKKKPIPRGRWFTFHKSVRGKKRAKGVWMYDWIMEWDNEEDLDEFVKLLRKTVPFQEDIDEMREDFIRKVFKI